MARRILPILAMALFSGLHSASAQTSLDDYLPAEVYLPGIPEPGAVTGHPVGEWHLTHDRLTFYMKELAESSDRVVYQEYARSHEDRPLFHLVITSPGNHDRLEEIRTEHLKLSDPGQSASLSIEQMPLVVRLGYGVHGNESSASNASVLVAYYLAASESETVRAFLDSMVILLDPCLNPDGFNRHASWINMHKPVVPMTDENSRGFHEPWPGGRTNHYWFDLNRDWILLQHPESRGRARVFHQWKPNVQTDHHEMGSSSSFFFQPGVPSRTNPHTPARTTELTAMIGRYHSKALDGTGTLYYTEERFDDFYYGKGSSYPDVNGSVGILFEQAGTRGFERETPRGKLRFPYAIRNQVTVSLSTLNASRALRTELLEHQREFYRSCTALYEDSKVKGYLLGEGGDPSSLVHLLDILLQHQVRVYETGREISLNGTTFSPGSSYLVPMDQPQIRLVKSLLEPSLRFSDSLFYDVSAWTLPHAFNIPGEPVYDPGILDEITGERVNSAERAEGKLHTMPDAIGYLMPWNDYYAPSALYAIQKEGLVTQVTTREIGYKNHQIDTRFGFGTIFIPVEKQSEPPGRVRDILEQVAEESGIDIYPVATSYTPEGMDLGSQRIAPLTRPRILLLTGEGVRSLEAGEMWHLLDTRMKIPVTLADVGRLHRISLDSYTHILMPSGSYGQIRESTREKMEQWLRKGGTVVALNSANQWLAEHGLCELKFRESRRDSSGYRPYSGLTLERGARRIAGTIFEAEIDRSHPIGFGLFRSRIPLFRTSTLIAEHPYRPYAVPVRYTTDPLLSGYVHPEIYEQLRSTPAVVIGSLGEGRVVSFMDNPNFRGFWFGSSRLFMNAIFFAPVISSASTRR